MIHMDGIFNEGPQVYEPEAVVSTYSRHLLYYGKHFSVFESNALRGLCCRIRQNCSSSSATSVVAI